MLMMQGPAALPAACVIWARSMPAPCCSVLLPHTTSICCQPASPRAHVQHPTLALRVLCLPAVFNAQQTSRVSGLAKGQQEGQAGGSGQRGERGAAERARGRAAGASEACVERTDRLGVEGQGGTGEGPRRGGRGEGPRLAQELHKQQLASSSWPPLLGWRRVVCSACSAAAAAAPPALHASSS